MRKHIAALIAALILIPVIVLGADLVHSIAVRKSIANASVSNNDNTDGSIIDGRGYRSVTYVIVTGTLADSDVTLTPSIIAGDNDVLSDGAAVSGIDLVGTIAGATVAATDDNTAKVIAYGGTKRYTKLRITPANNTGAAPFSASAILGHPQYLPTP
jgi:hypothetical protein